MLWSKAIHFVFLALITFALFLAGDPVAMLGLEPVPVEDGMPHAQQQDSEDPSADSLPDPHSPRRKAWQAAGALPEPMLEFSVAQTEMSKPRAWALQRWHGTSLPGLTCLKLPSASEPAPGAVANSHAYDLSVVPQGARRSFFWGSQC